MYGLLTSFFMYHILTQIMKALWRPAHATTTLDTTVVDLLTENKYFKDSIRMEISTERIFRERTKKSKSDIDGV